MNNNGSSDILQAAKIEYSYSPDWRKVIPGVNFDAKCKSCNKNVIVQYGIPPEEGVSVAAQLLNLICPLCKKILPPGDATHIWFSNCHYKMKSKSQDNKISKVTDIAEQAVKVPLNMDPNGVPIALNIKAYNRF